MHADFRFDDTAPVFTLSCPGYRKHRVDATGVGGGNLVFSIDHQVVAEIAHADLLESWKAASELSASEALKMTEVAARHLGEILDSGLDAADLTEAVTDAAVVFLLAMKRQGVKDPKRIPACTVMWDGHEGRERVLLGV